MLRTGSFSSAFPRSAVQIGFCPKQPEKKNSLNSQSTITSRPAAGLAGLPSPLVAGSVARTRARAGGRALLTSFLTCESSRAARLFSLVTLRSSLLVEDVLTPARSAGEAVRAARWIRRAEAELSMAAGRQGRRQGALGREEGGATRIGGAGKTRGQAQTTRGPSGMPGEVRRGDEGGEGVYGSSGAARRRFGPAKDCLKFRQARVPNLGPGLGRGLGWGGGARPGGRAQRGRSILLGPRFFFSGPAKFRPSPWPAGPATALGRHQGGGDA